MYIYNTIDMMKTCTVCLLYRTVITDTALLYCWTILLLVRLSTCSDCRTVGGAVIDWPDLDLSSWDNDNGNKPARCGDHYHYPACLSVCLSSSLVRIYPVVCQPISCSLCRDKVGRIRVACSDKMKTVDYSNDIVMYPDPIILYVYRTPHKSKTPLLNNRTIKQK